ncbi:MAG: CHAD domain-containing protein, partial [Candidatus Thermoplasmatota archaeon]|nr:CHAD domain-containing protein [Candidatus Thermoplasmatota archaeon]
VQQALHTRYFDTPDFALSAQGVALRVRRAGRRWMQTLKTEGERQGGLSRRAEYEMAVARGSPDWGRFPADALACVPEALRAQLVPVFETHFNRTAWLLKGKGGARIEVALDVGEVRAGEHSQPICEIELELKAGQPDALFALALEWAGAFDCLPFDVSKAERGVRLAHGVAAAPATAAPLVLDDGMSVEDGFAAICQACLAQFQANLPGVLFPLPNPDGTTSHSTKPASGQVAGYLPLAGEGANAGPKPIDDIEYVHQARVALRRLRAALRLYRKACVPPDELLDGLRTLAAALGPARDWDVLCGETLPAIAPRYPDADAWQRGLQALERRRTEVRVAMREALTQARPGAWLLAMQRWLLQRGWRSVPEEQRSVQLSPLDAWARRALQKGHRPIVRSARNFGKLASAQRHALRIAIKRQRYAAEFFQSLFGAPPEGHKRRQGRYLRVLRNAQDSLGRANDAHVAWGLLTASQVESGPMGDFALGWLAAKQAEAANGESARHARAFLKLKAYW